MTTGKWEMGNGTETAPYLFALSHAYRVHDVIRANLLHGVETLDHLPEDRVDAVQVPRVRLTQHHEELAAARVLARVRHGQRADLVLPRVARGLALDLVAGAAGSNTAIAFRQVA